MILLREAQEKDVSDLARLSGIPGLFNLTDDKDALREKIIRSDGSFRGRFRELWETKYLFVAEDLESKKAVATSMVAGQHGTEESPHFFFDVGVEKKFSKTIGTGFLHGTLRLKSMTNGPSEIGGLVVDREHRNTAEKVGRQIAFVRFLYVFMNPQRFREQMIAELLPPLNKKGQSPLWEAVGRRFTNMDYWEADALCQKNKEFILSLFPSGKIYTSFLPAEARNAIGKVGKETEPVFHMLTKIGFHYAQQVDPFDGGPHLWANIRDLAPIRGGFRGQLSETYEKEESRCVSGLFCKGAQVEGQFRACAGKARIDGKKLHLLDAPVSHEACDLLKIHPGDDVAFVPYYSM